MTTEELETATLTEKRKRLRRMPLTIGEQNAVLRGERRIQEILPPTTVPYRPRKSDRYLVCSVTGWAIDPARYGQRGGGRAPPTSYYVLDRLDVHRIVGDFTAQAHNVSSSVKRQTLAETLCARLEAQWRQWKKENAEDQDG